MLYRISFLLTLIMLLSCSRPKVQRTVSASTKFPSWITNRPVATGYYTGIGAAQVSGSDARHIEIAKNNALNDLVSEIEVKISSQSVFRQFENNSEFNEEYESLSNASIKDEIEGFELVDSWGDDQHYWVYYRLSKAHYQELKRIAVERAKALGLDYYNKGKVAEQTGDVSNALRNYLKGMNELKNHLDESLEYNDNGETKYLSNDLLTAIVGVLEKTSVSIGTSNLQAKAFEPIDSTIGFRFTYNSGGNVVPMRSFPFKIAFKTGQGTASKRSVTDNQGSGSFKLGRITGTENFQEISVSLDLHDLLAKEEGESTILERLLSLKSTVPEAILHLKVERVVAQYEFNELEFGKLGSRQTLKNEIKRLLSAKNFSFNPNADASDLKVSIKSTATKGRYNASHDVYTVYIDCYISVIDIASGDKIYFKGFDQIRGQQVRSWENALKVAQQNMIEKFKKEIIPELSQLNY